MNQSRIPATRVRVFAASFGTVNHALFAAAIASMAIGLWHGLAVGRGTLHGAAAALANLTLALQFPLLHSFLLGRRGSRWLGGLFPAPFGAALLSTTFATLASLQVLATFWLWSPSGAVLWQPHGWALAGHGAAFAGSWLFLILAIHDAGSAVQSGALGWWSVLRGRAPRYPPFPTRRTFALCRQPIYLAFALLLWSAPTWTIDRLELGVPWTAYCLLGPLRKERRYVARHGAAYRAYRRRVPYMIPLPNRRP